jgi:hypothetical protein
MPNPSREDLVTKALSFVGVDVGQGYDGPNPFSADLGLPAEAWCADFVTDMFKRTGGPLLLPSMQADHATGYSYCPDGLAYAKSKHAVGDSWNAQPGDIAFFCWDGSGTAEHTGIVVEWKDGVLYTVEGNSGADGGVNRAQYAAPSGVGNPQVLGVANAGKIVSFGATDPTKPPPARPPSPKSVVALATMERKVAPGEESPGYWLVTADGGVTAFGAAVSYGDKAGSHLPAPIAGAAATSTGLGYWLVAADGDVFGFGDAKVLGTMAGKKLAAPMVGMAAAPDGKGYWLVAADGGVFKFGSAGFDGSEGGKKLNAPVVGMAAGPDGKGYWLVAADGGVFSFGAKFFGSTA